MPTKAEQRIAEALEVLAEFKLPNAQRNERSALCLLALLDLRPNRDWSEASDPLIGITPIMDWSREHYQKAYAPNTRETFRRQTMHQFCDAGIAALNPDDPGRAVNSPKNVYQITNETLVVLKARGTSSYQELLAAWSKSQSSLIEQYAQAREMQMVPINLGGKTISLSPGAHSSLIKAMVEEFGPRFVPDGRLVYAGDTGDKWGFFDEKLLASLGVAIDGHGKMPDVIIYYPSENWLILGEAVTSHGPVNGKRHNELRNLFAKAKPGLVFLSAFPDRRTFTKYAEEISWETEVWIADNPTHLIHYNGVRFLGPHP